MSALMRGNLRMAYSAIKGARWRSVLTMTGVIVGIVAVVTVVGIGEGVKRQVTGTLDNYGKDLLVVRPGEVGGDDMLASGNTDVLFGMNNATNLTSDDFNTVQRTPGVKQAAPLGIVSGRPVADDGRTARKAFVVATDSDLDKVLKQPVEEGDFWTDDKANANQAVIGQKVAGDLFGEPVPLGRRFNFRGQTFIVRGVFQQWVNVPFSPTANFNNAIFIPYQTASRITHNDSGLYTVLAKTGDPKTVEDVQNSLTSRLTKTHGGQKDFSVLDAKQAASVSTDVVHMLSVWIWAVAAISLFIGGVGIMNIMLLTVTERMHEIGVRKAIGASSHQILWQFLIEATVLSLIGCVIGVALSLGSIGLLYAYTNLKPVISWQAVGIATAVSLAVGIIFGTAPAVKAARKDPIQALRHE
jgi:putative ABC transport system permease protein